MNITIIIKRPLLLNKKCRIRIRASYEITKIIMAYQTHPAYKIHRKIFKIKDKVRFDHRSRWLHEMGIDGITNPHAV